METALALADSLVSRARARNPRWPAAIAALAAGASHADAARAAGVKTTTIARWRADDDFAQLVHDATTATVADAMQRLRAGSKRASEVLLEQMDADPDAQGWTRRALAARDVLDRVGAAAPSSDARAVAAAAAGGAAGAALASRAETVDAVRALLGDDAARAAARRLMLDVVPTEPAEERSPGDGGGGSGAPAPTGHNTAP